MKKEETMRQISSSDTRVYSSEKDACSSPERESTFQQETGTVSGSREATQQLGMNMKSKCGDAMTDERDIECGIWYNGERSGSCFGSSCAFRGGGNGDTTISRKCLNNQITPQNRARDQ